MASAVAMVETLVPEDDGSAEATMREKSALRYNTVRPVDHYERGRGHHRDETRRLKTASFAHLDHRHARQARQVVRWRRDLGKDQLTNERIHLVTNLPPDAATGSRLAAWARGHWRIENQL
ncbi:hypothetical protein ACWEQ8_00965 [Streptomyces noursei]